MAARTDTPSRLLQDLQSVGVTVDSIWKLVNDEIDYRAALPLLVDWLSTLEDRVEPGEYREALREGLIRALSVPAARPLATAEMLRQFSLVEDRTGFGLRWVVGNALSVLADDRHFDAVAAIVSGRNWGPARQMVVQGLGRSKKPDAVPLLMEMLADEDVVAHAVIALRKLKNPAARAALEQLRTHSRPLVRKEVAKALKALGDRGTNSVAQQR